MDAEGPSRDLYRAGKESLPVSVDSIELDGPAVWLSIRQFPIFFLSPFLDGGSGCELSPRS